MHLTGSLQNGSPLTLSSMRTFLHDVFLHVSRNQIPGYSVYKGDEILPIRIPILQPGFHSESHVKT